MIKIYRTSIAQSGRGSRREAERAAVSLLVKRALGPGAVLTHDEHGAPRVQGVGDVHVSVSHSADTCVLAVSERPVGVDIERGREQLLRVARKILTAGEQQRGPYDVEGLTLLWTAKEAVFKCAADPSLVISDITVSLSQPASAGGAVAQARGREFSVSFFQAGTSSVIAVAVEAGAEKPDILFCRGAE